jgi:SWI/SNF-related matrix-associated actin-dependent regulator of chromatin subfamily A member 5
MAPSRAKTAFQYFQSAKLAEIKQELGGATSMGQAMTELSQRWKSLDDSEKQPFVELEHQDRIRFEQESAQADALAIQIQEERRAALEMRDGEGHAARGARAKVEEERELKEERKRRRQEATDPELLAERNRMKQAKKQETMERQRLRQQEENLVKERHRKLDKQQTQKAHQRLEYLLKQSSIFAKLKGGPPEQKMAPMSPSGKSHHRDDKVHHDSSDEVDEDDEEEHVFLTKQPSCIKFGQLKPYQLEALNWMIHLAEKGLNGILAGASLK